MAASPYTWVSVPRELRALSAELASLGGGDTRLGTVSVACLVGGIGRSERAAAAARKASLPTVWREDDDNGAECVCVRDRRRGGGGGVRRTSSTSVRSGDDAEDFALTHGAGPVHRFAVPRAIDLDESHAAERLWRHVGEPATEWLWDGFNATVVAYGSGSAARSSAIFGSDDGGKAHGADKAPSGVAELALAALFAMIAAADEPQRYVVALSCYDLRGDVAVDLLSEGALAATARRGGTSGGATESRAERRQKAVHGYASALRGKGRAKRVGSGSSGGGSGSSSSSSTNASSGVSEPERTIVEAGRFTTARGEFI